ncbi:MAG: terpene cyclase/mutase family protein [Planctomycetales bacterium]|nr:terpene cyclase/mutase family protein [Planctomycetales bacterium]
MNFMPLKRLSLFVVAANLLVHSVHAQSGAPVPLSAAIDAATWKRVDASTDKALAWLASGQRRTGNGSFAAPTSGQPGVTGLSVLAFLAKGHVPGGGKYGDELDAAIDYILSCQRSDGLIAGGPGGRDFDGKTAIYNHAIAGLVLCQAYGMVDRDRAAEIEQVVPKALAFTRKRQTLPKSYPQEKGGWRYFYEGNPESDLSVTGWQMMFLRAAKNAGFDVPQEHIDEALKYVRSCWNEREGVFYYMTTPGHQRWSRGMCGVGIISLTMAGEHQTPMAKKAGRFILQNSFRRYGDRVGSGERWFYSAYVCSQAMSQLGGEYWERFYPSLVETLMATQRPDGSFPSEPYSNDSQYGNACTTNFSVLAMTPPLQLLPLYQR